MFDQENSIETGIKYWHMALQTLHNNILVINRADSHLASLPKCSEANHWLLVKESAS